MLRFYFSVNRSFLGHTTRPITIPKTQVDYEKLEREELCDSEAVVICPNGQHLSGFIYYGEAGYGPYYQLRVRGDHGDPLGGLPFGQKLLVDIRKSVKGIEVELTQVDQRHR